YDERIAIADDNSLRPLAPSGPWRPPAALSAAGFSCDANLLLAARRRGSKCQARPNILGHAGAAQSQRYWSLVAMRASPRARVRIGWHSDGSGLRHQHSSRARRVRGRLPTITVGPRPRPSRYGPTCRCLGGRSCGPPGLLHRLRAGDLPRPYPAANFRTRRPGCDAVPARPVAELLSELVGRPANLIAALLGDEDQLALPSGLVRPRIGNRTAIPVESGKIAVYEIHGARRPLRKESTRAAAFTRNTHGAALGTVAKATTALSGTT